MKTEKKDKKEQLQEKPEKSFKKSSYSKKKKVKKNILIISKETLKLQSIIGDMNAIKYLTDKGISLVYDKPKLGSDNKLITFIHPKSSPGILIELCQKV